MASAPGSEFGRLLRERRLGAWLTQEALAEAAGIGLRTLRNLERGVVERPQAASVHLPADALGLTGTDRAMPASELTGKFYEFDHSRVYER